VITERLRARVLPARQEKARRELRRNQQAQASDPGVRVNWHHRNFLTSWWQLSYPREALMSALSTLSRYIACGRVTRRPIFVFVDPSIHPNDALQVFALEDDYSFGVLQSQLHWLWFTERCSTLKNDPRYTSTTVFDAFPWPQEPTACQVMAVAHAATALRRVRREEARGRSLRQLAQSAEQPLRQAHAQLDAAVAVAYGLTGEEDPLAALLRLNQQIAARERAGAPVQGPGPPTGAVDLQALRTHDRLQMPENHAPVGAGRAASP